MAKLAKFNLTQDQLLPETGDLRLNTCSNPDCRNFGQLPRTKMKPLPARPNGNRCATATEVLRHQGLGVGKYNLSGTSDKNDRRISTAFEFADDPHEWTDMRALRCQALLVDGTICGTGFSLLSEDHLNEEVARLRDANGVLRGPECGCCGRRFLDAPGEFVLNGAHQRTKDRHGQPIKNVGAPTSVRVIHRPCKGKPGARLTISMPHQHQRETKDNLRILRALLNSSGILDVQRMLGSSTSSEKIGISRIYNRIKWLEHVFLAYEQEMLRRWRQKIEKSGKSVEHRLSHDDLVLTVNWETASDRRNTLLNCSVTADATSGYLYRIDVDFDPRVEPLALFNTCYLDEERMPANLRKTYRQKSGAKFSAPLFALQRPTGRPHEPQFFAACSNELNLFLRKIEKEYPQGTPAEKRAFEELKGQVLFDLARLKTIGEDWFGFTTDSTTTRGPFRGITTRDVYTKAAHLTLVKEMLPRGKIVLATEQEAMLARVIPHIFEDEIRENSFQWLTMSFNKGATKSDILAKTREYRKQRWKFYRS